MIGCTSYGAVGDVGQIDGLGADPVGRIPPTAVQLAALLGFLPVDGVDDGGAGGDEKHGDEGDHHTADKAVHEASMASQQAAIKHAPLDAIGARRLKGRPRGHTAHSFWRRAQAIPGRSPRS